MSGNPGLRRQTGPDEIVGRGSGSAARHISGAPARVNSQIQAATICIELRVGPAALGSGAKTARSREGWALGAGLGAYACLNEDARRRTRGRLLRPWPCSR